MNFSQAVKSCINNYVNGKGRAARSEYWYFILFNFLAGIVAAILDVVLFAHAGGLAHPITLVIKLALLLPSITVAIRRLHDVNRSGWWILISLTIIGLIPLIIWYCSKGTTGDNRFGRDPLAT